MFFINKKNTGFTLIELLVVVAVISLLSSIIFASLNVARAKGKDALIKTEVNQLRTLLEQNYNDYGSYSNLNQGVWYTISLGNCNSLNLGSYAPQALSICWSILNQEPTNDPNVFYLGNSIPPPNNGNYYSIMAYLPYKATFYCIGSSGRTSDTEWQRTWLSPGCFGSP